MASGGSAFNGGSGGQGSASPIPRAVEPLVVTTLLGSRAALRAVVWLPGAGVVCEAGDEGVVRIYRPCGQRMAEVAAHKGRISALCVAGRKRDIVVSGGADGMIYAISGRGTMQVRKGPLASAALPGGDRCVALCRMNTEHLLVGGFAGNLLTYKLDWGRLRLVHTVEHAYRIVIRDVAKHRSLVASVGKDDSVVLWNDSMERITKFYVNGARSVAISDAFVAIGCNNYVSLYENGVQRDCKFNFVAEIFVGCGIISTMKFLQCGTLVTGGEFISFVDPRAGRVFELYRPPAKYVSTFDFLDDGTMITAGAGRDSTSIISVSSVMEKSIRTTAFAPPLQTGKENVDMGSANPYDSGELWSQPKSPIVHSKRQRISYMDLDAPDESFDDVPSRHTFDARGSNQQLNQRADNEANPYSLRLGGDTPNAQQRHEAEIEQPYAQRFDATRNCRQSEHHVENNVNRHSYRPDNDLFDAQPTQRMHSERTYAHHFESRPNSSQLAQSVEIDANATNCRNVDASDPQHKYEPSSIGHNRMNEEDKTHGRLNNERQSRDPRRRREDDRPSAHRSNEDVNAQRLPISNHASRDPRRFNEANGKQAYDVEKRETQLAQPPCDNDSSGNEISTISKRGTEGKPPQGEVRGANGDEVDVSPPEADVSHRRPPSNSDSVQCLQSGAAAKMAHWQSRGLSAALVEGLQIDELAEAMAAFMLRYRAGWMDKFAPLHRCLARHFDENLMDSTDVAGAAAIHPAKLAASIANAMRDDPTVGNKTGLVNGVRRFFDKIGQ